MKKKFDDLKSKYDLPSFEDLDKCFEIYSIDEDDDVIREILRKMNSIVEYYLGILEDLIQPDSRLYTLREAGFLDKKSRESVSVLYSKLVFLNRSFLELHLDYSEEKGVVLIKHVFFEWLIIRNDLLIIVRLLKDFWSKPVVFKQERGYFG